VLTYHSQWYELGEQVSSASRTARSGPRTLGGLTSLNRVDDPPLFARHLFASERSAWMHSAFSFGWIRSAFSCSLICASAIGFAFWVVPRLGEDSPEGTKRRHATFLIQVFKSYTPEARTRELG